MAESVQQYVDRIKSYLGNEDFLTVLSNTSRRLHELLDGASDLEVQARPAPGKWSVIEQLAHLADVEIVVGYRVRTILGAGDGVAIQAFNQDKWAAALHYSTRQLAPTLKAFDAARENNLALYCSLSDAEWNCYGLHTERGHESVREVATLQGGHDLNHLRQMESLLGKGATTAR
jgi:DinB family protein